MEKSEVSQEMLCTKSHEYFVQEGSLAKIGITDYAVEQLGDIVFVELPEVGTTFSKGEVFGTVESVKAASELYMPVGGKVVEINERLILEPELINDDTFNTGWLIKIADFDASELEDAMLCEEYKDFVEKTEEE